MPYLASNYDANAQLNDLVYGGSDVPPPDPAGQQPAGYRPPDEYSSQAAPPPPDQAYGPPPDQGYDTQMAGGSAPATAPPSAAATAPPAPYVDYTAGAGSESGGNYGFTADTAAPATAPPDSASYGGAGHDASAYGLAPSTSAQPFNAGAISPAQPDFRSASAPPPGPLVAPGTPPPPTTPYQYPRAGAGYDSTPDQYGQPVNQVFRTPPAATAPAPSLAMQAAAILPQYDTTGGTTFQDIAGAPAVVSRMAPWNRPRPTGTIKTDAGFIFGPIGGGMAPEDAATLQTAADVIPRPATMPSPPEAPPITGPLEAMPQTGQLPLPAPRASTAPPPSAPPPEAIPAPPPAGPPVASAEVPLPAPPVPRPEDYVDVYTGARLSLSDFETHNVGPKLTPQELAQELADGVDEGDWVYSPAPSSGAMPPPPPAGPPVASAPGTMPPPPPISPEVAATWNDAAQAARADAGQRWAQQQRQAPTDATGGPRITAAPTTYQGAPGAGLRAQQAAPPPATAPAVNVGGGGNRFTTGRGAGAVPGEDAAANYLAAAAAAAALPTFGYGAWQGLQALRSGGQSPPPPGVGMAPQNSLGGPDLQVATSPTYQGSTFGARTLQKRTADVQLAASPNATQFPVTPDAIAGTASPFGDVRVPAPAVAGQEPTAPSNQPTAAARPGEPPKPAPGSYYLTDGYGNVTPAGRLDRNGHPAGVGPISDTANMDPATGMPPAGTVYSVSMFVPDPANPTTTKLQGNVLADATTLTTLAKRGYHLGIPSEDELIAMQKDGAVPDTQAWHDAMVGKLMLVPPQLAKYVTNADGTSPVTYTDAGGAPTTTAPVTTSAPSSDYTSPYVPYTRAPYVPYTHSYSSGGGSSSGSSGYSHPSSSSSSHSYGSSSSGHASTMPSGGSGGGSSGFDNPIFDRFFASKGGQKFAYLRSKKGRTTTKGHTLSSGTAKVAFPGQTAATVPPQAAAALAAARAKAAAATKSAAARKP